MGRWAKRSQNIFMLAGIVLVLWKWAAASLIVRRSSQSFHSHQVQDCVLTLKCVFSESGRVCQQLSRTLRVDVFGQFERVGVGQVSVGGGDGQDEAALSRNELHDHVSDLMLDVRRLIAHRHFSDARQVDERQIQHCTQGRGQMVRWVVTRTGREGK